MAYNDTKKRFDAAYTLLIEPGTSRQKLSSIRSLIQGIHPGIDEKLKQCDEAFSHLEKITDGEFIDLASDHLPESTEEEKKHKKFLLLFIKTWKELASEIKRAQAELDTQSNGQNTPQKPSLGKRLFKPIKGPFGIITIVAVGAALALQATSVRMTIKNNGCGTMTPGSLPIPLPGLSLPKDPILSNGSAVATLPRVTISIDNSKPGVMQLKALKLSLSFELPNTISDVTLNGESILKKNTVVHLSDRREHTLIFSCKK